MGDARSVSNGIKRINNRSQRADNSSYFFIARSFDGEHWMVITNCRKQRWHIGILGKGNARCIADRLEEAMKSRMDAINTTRCIMFFDQRLCII